MIEESTTVVTPVGKTIQKYRDLGYVCNVGTKLEISVSDLPIQSHQIITAICDRCGQSRKLPYYAYMRNWNRYSYYGCNYCKQEKIEATNQRLYGVNRPIQNKQIHLKLEETNKEIYGFACASKSERVKQAASAHREKEGSIKIENDILYKYRALDIISIGDHEYEIKCRKGHEYTISDMDLYKRIKYNIEVCLQCNPINPNKVEIDEIYAYIRDNYDGEIKRESNDVYLVGLGIEILIIDFHIDSEVYQERTYLHKKVRKIEANGLEYLIVYIDEWKKNKGSIQSIINKVVLQKEDIIYSDGLIIEELVEEESKLFIATNGIEYNGGLSIGIKESDELLGILIISRKGGEYKIEKYIERIGTKIIGGIESLFSYFKDVYDYKRVYGHSKGLVDIDNYKKLGFKRTGKTNIGYTYIIEGKRVESREVKRLDLGFGKIEGRSDHQICIDNGIFRIYDGGGFVWEYSSNQ